MKKHTLSFLTVIAAISLAIPAAAQTGASPSPSPTAAASPAPQMVKRILEIKAIDADTGLKIDPVRLRYLTELFRSAFAEDSTYLVAEGKDKPDTTVSAKILANSRTKLTLRVHFEDSREGSISFDKDYSPDAALGTQDVLGVFKQVQKDLSPRLVAVAQTVKVQIDEKIEQKVEVKEVQKGVSLTFTGAPGQVLTLVDNTIVTMGEDGSATIPDLAQNSNLVVTTSLPGFYTRVIESPVGTQDAKVDAKLEAIPRLSFGLKLEPNLEPFVFYGIWPEHLFLMFGIETSILGISPRPHSTVSANPQFANFFQPEIGALLYITPPEWIMQVGAQLTLGTRFEDQADGVLRFSPRVALDSRLKAVAELRIFRNFSFFLAMGPRITIGTTDVFALNDSTATQYDYPDQAAGQLTPSDLSPNDTVTTFLNGQGELSFDAELGVRIWL